jgi:hypothetical protein
VEIQRDSTVLDVVMDGPSLRCLCQDAGVAFAVLVLLLGFVLVFDLILIVNPRGIDHGRPGPRFSGEGFTSGLPELSFSFPKSYNSCAPDYNMIPLCVYPLVLYSTTVFHHCLLLLMHATISWCPASSVLECTIVRFPGKVASALLPQLIRRRLIYALLSRYAQPVLYKAPSLCKKRT